jgi:hypothetical protein
MFLNPRNCRAGQLLDETAVRYTLAKDARDACHRFITLHVIWTFQTWHLRNGVYCTISNDSAGGGTWDTVAEIFISATQTRAWDKAKISAKKFSQLQNPGEFFENKLTFCLGQFANGGHRRWDMGQVTDFGHGHLPWDTGVTGRPNHSK